MRALPQAIGVFIATTALAAACGGSNGNGSGFQPPGGDGGNGNPDAPMMLGGDGGLTGETGGIVGDPLTCAQAMAAHSYIGCDYWPTVVANNVWSVFDYAVVVANATPTAATVTVTGPNNTNQMTMVPPNQLATIYLPWVTALKGPDTDTCGTAMPLTASVLAPASAYHLVASVPVTVYQFNALEYQGQGGPAGKDWSSCPGNSVCNSPTGPITVGCFSFTNDASLLLPSTAMTGNYRVTGEHGWSAMDFTSGMTVPVLGSYFAVTGTQNGTTVNVKISSTGTVLAGGSIQAAGPGQTLTFSLNAGDVAEIVGPASSAADFSGSLVQASAPVQVIAGTPCIDQPLLLNGQPVQACDHLEQSVFPAETLGKHYIVTVPTSPHGSIVGHVVRIYGNVDGTHLTYSPGGGPGCPAMINAGEVVECQNGVPVSQDFEVTGDHEFSVGTFMLGGSLQDPGVGPPNQLGDPSQSLTVAVEQYRKKYIFLAPTDYTESYVDIVHQPSTTLSLDGAPVSANPTTVGSGTYSISRVKLGPGNAGAHVLTASNPVGIQVMGYGAYTSYQYPGGLDLVPIAPPPPK